MVKNYKNSLQVDVLMYILNPHQPIVNFSSLIPSGFLSNL